MTGYFIAAGIALLLALLYVLLGPLLVESDEVVVLEKRFGRRLTNGQFLALNGEAGFQADTLRTGLHFKCRIIYKIHKCKMVTIKQDEMGYVFARSGQPLAPDQALARKVECSNYQDARAFIQNGGQKGMQREILREGTYLFNLAQFVILTNNGPYYIPVGKDRHEINDMQQRIADMNGFKPIIINGDEDVMGTVITNEGRALAQSVDITSKEVIAPIVGNDPDDPATYHNNFQKIDEFLAAGGCKGRQLQILTQGKYYINRLFATVEMEKNIIIGASQVGVVISYYGENGKDISGSDYRHGDLVEDGCKGVLANPLRTGKYPLNPYAYNVVIVPVDNFVLRWKHGVSNEYNYDTNLDELSVITYDGYKPFIPLSIVVHIDYMNAPKVIQRFGSVQKLVEQTIDPMISAHFKKIAEKKTLLDFIQQKSEITNIVKQQMGEAFEEFNLEIEDVLIDTPESHGDQRIETMMAQLSNRQLAVEQSKTYTQQMESEAKLRELNEAKAKAAQQKELTESHIQINIDTNRAEAKRSVAEKERDRRMIDADAHEYEVRIDAKAKAEATVAVADANAHKTSVEGSAQAEAAKKNADALGGPRLLVQKELGLAMARALAEGRIDIVPRNLIQNGGAAGEAPTGYDALSNLVNLIVLKNFGEQFGLEVPEEAKNLPETAASEEE